MILYVVVVTGSTWEHRDRLKELGFRWRKGKKAWFRTFNNHYMADWMAKKARERALDAEIISPSVAKDRGFLTR